MPTATTGPGPATPTRWWTGSRPAPRGASTVPTSPTSSTSAAGPASWPGSSRRPAAGCSGSIPTRGWRTWPGGTGSRSRCPRSRPGTAPAVPSTRSSPGRPSTGWTRWPARALRPGGRLAVFWNAFQPPSDLAEAFAAVYRRVMPDSPLFRGGAGHGGPDAYQGPCAKAAEGMRQAAVFGEPEQWRFDWDRRYTRDEWLDQLPTSGFWTQIPAAGQREIL